MYPNWSHFFRRGTQILLSVCVTVFLPMAMIGHAFAGPGECPGPTVQDINKCFYGWANAADGLGIPWRDDVQCVDNPSTPLTFLLLNVGTSDDDNLSVQVDGTSSITPIEVTGIIGGALIELCAGLSAFTLSLSDQHICRATILRSVPWRQLCIRNPVQ